MTFEIFGSKADAAAYLSFSSKSPKARAVRSRGFCAERQERFCVGR
jgi:hypothetical protein